jgi:hypothetical protein
MKTLVLALAVVLLAVPAMADVKIIITDVSPNPETPTAQISYDATTELPELVRAFALDIVATGANIVEVNDYAVGDDNGGYGIFPGNFSLHITVNPTTGNVDNWGVAGYTPVAPPGDPDALTGLGTAGVTIEMGALYDTAAPGETGVLCTLVCDGPCTMSATGNAIRGNVVLENAAGLVPDVTEATDVPIGAEPECLPSDHPDYGEWVAVGKPRCWCLKRQCYGDVDGEKEGGAKTGYFYVKYTDLNVLVAAWPVKEPPKGPGIDSVELGGIKGICADSARDQEGGAKTGYFRVHYNDLNLLVASWPIKEPPKGPGLATDCGGDLDAEDL